MDTEAFMNLDGAKMVETLRCKCETGVKPNKDLL